MRAEYIEEKKMELIEELMRRIKETYLGDTSEATAQIIQTLATILLKS